MTAIGVPLRHVTNFPGHHRLPQVEEASEWPARGFLVIGGSYGTGKSFCAACAVFEYLKRSVKDPFNPRSWENIDRAASSVMWATAAEMTLDREIPERAKSAALTVIDDLGGESEAPQGIGVARGIILRRYDMKLPTVITTCLTMPDIASRYGGGITARLTEDMGDGGGIIDCGGVSVRSFFDTDDET
jgi:DNA replication protein DnaC